jgi:hypothetical protein
LRAVKFQTNLYLSVIQTKGLSIPQTPYSLSIPQTPYSLSMSISFQNQVIEIFGCVVTHMKITEEA